MKAAARSVLALALLACSPVGDRGAARSNTAIISVRISAKVLNWSLDTESKFLVFLPLLKVTETGELRGAPGAELGALSRPPGVHLPPPHRGPLG